MNATLVAHRGSALMSRAELALVPCPDATETHKTLPHIDVVDGLRETLGFRHIGVVREQFAVSEDGMKMFGILDLEPSFDGCRFSLGLRNANDKSMRLALTVGFRVFVCDNMAFKGDFTPIAAKHTKNFSLVDALDMGVARMQRGFDPMRQQVETWRGAQISDTAAKEVIYGAFIEGKLDVPRNLARSVHSHYFDPRFPDFESRTMWSLHNAFTSAFGDLDPVPRFKATAALGDFLGAN